MFGFLNINKPKGMTSHDVVAVLRKITHIKQIGHTGTLDPLATGVLPIAISKASRLIEYLNEDKAYIAKLQFGFISDTYDSEGNIEKYSDKKVTKEELIQKIEKFKGTIEQIPPAHSAVHYKGKRLYELARKGIIPDDIPKRNVTISKLEILEFDEEKQTATLEIACSKGTYIRSIVNDLGLQLDTGAIMTDLIRTKSGLFSINTAIDLKDLKDSDDVPKYLINPIEVLTYKQRELSQKEYEDVSHGRSIKTSDYENNELILLTQNKKLCAIAQKDKKEQKLLVRKVFI